MSPAVDDAVHVPREGSPPAIDPGGGRSAASWRQAVAALPPVVDWPPRGRLAVVAPHPDDEVLGIGGALARGGGGPDVFDVVTVTDGEEAMPRLSAVGRRELAARRRGESRAAHHELGIAVVRHDLGLPDGGIARAEEELATRLAPLVDRVDVIAVVAADDGHPDHDATGRVVVRLARAAGTRLVRYAVWAWNWDDDTSGRLHGASRLTLGPGDRARKAAAIRAHASQLERSAGHPPVLPARFLDHHRGPYEVVWDDQS